MKTQITQHTEGSEHTPTPWMVNPNRNADFTYRIVNETKCVVQSINVEANAAFIVRAVNSYAEREAELERLKHSHEAYKRIIDALSSWVKSGRMPKYSSLMPDTDETFGEVITKAIAQAEGK